MAGRITIDTAPQRVNADELHPYLVELCTHLPIKGLPYLTDGSMLWDIVGNSEEYLERVVKGLGMEVTKTDLFVDILERMRERDAVSCP